MEVSHVCGVYETSKGYNFTVIRVEEGGAGTLSPGPSHDSYEAMATAYIVHQTKNGLIYPTDNTM